MRPPHSWGLARVKVIDGAGYGSRSPGRQRQRRPRKIRVDTLKPQAPRAVAGTPEGSGGAQHPIASFQGWRRRDVPSLPGHEAGPCSPPGELTRGWEGTEPGRARGRSTRVLSWESA